MRYLFIFFGLIGLIVAIFFLTKPVISRLFCQDEINYWEKEQLKLQSDWVYAKTQSGELKKNSDALNLIDQQKKWSEQLTKDKNQKYNDCMDMWGEKYWSFNGIKQILFSSKTTSKP